MKKILYVTTVLLSTLVFLFTFHNFIFQNQLNILGLRLNVTHPDLQIFSAATTIHNETEIDEVMNELCELSKKDKTDILLTKNYVNKYMIPIKDRYLFQTNQTNYLMNSIQLTNNNHIIDFTSNKNVYYTNDMNDENAYNYMSIMSMLDRMNPKKDIIRYFPMKSFKNNFDLNSENQLFFQFYTYQPEQMIEDIRDSSIGKYFNYDVMKKSIMSIQNIHYPVIQDDNYFNMIAIVSVISLLLLLIQTIYKKRHSIGIYKLMGISKGSITKRLFLNNLIINLIVYVIIQIILYIGVCGIYNEETIEFVQQLIIYFSYIVLLFIVIFIVAYFVVGRVNPTYAIKQKQRKGESFYFSGLLIKLFVILFASSSFIHVANITMNSGRELFNYMKRKNVMDEYYQVYRLDNNDLEKFEKVSRKILELGESRGVSYLNFQEMEVQPEEDKTVIAEVNQNFLNEYTLLDQKGNKIDINQKENIVYIPYSNKEIEKELSPKYLENVEYYYNSVCLFSNNYPTIFAYVKNPVIFKIGDIKNLSRYISINVNSNTTTIKALNYDNFMESYNDELKNELTFVKLKDVLRINLTGMVIGFMKYLLIVLLFIYFYYSIAKQCVMIYLYEYGHKISVRYLYGWHFIQRYRELFFVHLMGYIFSFIILILIIKLDILMTLKYCGIFFIIDFIIMIICILRKQSKLIKNNLKGGAVE